MPFSPTPARRIKRPRTSGDSKAVAVTFPVRWDLRRNLTVAAEPGWIESMDLLFGSPATNAAPESARGSRPTDTRLATLLPVLLTVMKRSYSSPALTVAG